MTHIADYAPPDRAAAWAVRQRVMAQRTARLTLPKRHGYLRLTVGYTGPELVELRRVNGVGRPPRHKGVLS